MKYSTSKILLGLLLLVACLAMPAHAEISLQGDGGKLYIRSVQGQIWTPVRQGLPTEMMLNPWGDANGDIFGSWSENPITGLPEVVWSRNYEGQHEVVFSWFDDGEWRGPSRISVSPANDLTPLLLHDHHGTRYVVWTSWHEGRSDAWLSVAPVDCRVFSTPSRMNELEEQGRYVHGMVTEHSLLTVHEEIREDGRYLQIFEYLLYQPNTRSTPMENPFQESELSLGDPEENAPMSGNSTPDPLGPKPATQLEEPVPSLPQLHMESATLWVDWVHDDDRMGYAVHDFRNFVFGGFVELKSLAEIDSVRKRIENQVLRDRGRR
jgi:hypothetical protein